MRRRLGPEVARQAEKSARGIAGLIIRQGAGEVKEIGKDPSSRSHNEITSAPAINAYRELSKKTLVAGTLALFNRSSGAEYLAGTDYEEDAAGGRYRNLTIPSGTSLDAYYHYYQSAGGGVTDHGALTGLGPEHDDHVLYAPAEGPERTLTDERIGERTVDQSLQSAADTGPISSLFSWIAGRLRAVTGETDWKTAPATTLADAAAHHGRSDNPHGVTPAQIQAAPAAHVGAGGAAHAGATPSTAGFLTAGGKTKLDGIQAGAQKNRSAQASLDTLKTVDGAGSGLDADLLDGSHASSFAAALAPFVNMMNDSGKFTAKENPLSRSCGPFVASDWFSPYNGATRTSAGKFVHNNSTHGGPGEALTQPVIDLLAAMGRTGNFARYGVEFHVTEYVAGNGTLVGRSGPDGVERYLLTANGGRAIFAFNTNATVAFWVRALDRSITITNASGLKNGAAYDSLLSPADGWCHVRHVLGNPIGYDSAAPRIRARSGDRVQIAIPAWFAGPVDPGIHTAPLPTINEFLE